MTRPDVFSIRRRVFTVAVTLLCCAALALVLFLHDYAERAADQAFDRLLAASALSVAGAVQIDDSDLAVELPFASLAMLSGSERVFYTVRNAGGGLITGYDELDAGLPLARSAVPVFSDRRYHGDQIRIASVGRLVSASQHAGWVTIRMAETRGARDALAEEILHRSALPLLVIVAVSLALLWFGIQHAFAPLNVIEGELRRRTPDDLHPLTGPVPAEVERLVEALNGFMARLKAMMSTLNNLVADAAHQVRTPLASLRAQAEVALEEPDAARLHERVARIHQNATHASQLINQLLMDATISHRLGMRETSTVGVAELINEARRRVPPADVPRLHIAIAPDLRRARVAGDRVALREMLGNLVDNALRYAPGDAVDIQVDEAAHGQIGITVADRGPGIADDEKATVMERFARGRSAQSLSGSGLGLSIVRNVATAHGGTVTLADRPGGGLAVTVSLPWAAATPLARAGGSLLSALVVGLCLSIVAAAWTPGVAEAAEATSAATPTHAGNAIKATSATPAPPAAYAVSRYPAPQGPSGAPGQGQARVLTVAGPTDAPLFAVLAKSFQQLRPDVSFVYREMDARELYDAAAGGRLRDVDVLISSAVDLQIRLANDGYALRHISPYASQLPAWAQWRSEVFGFSFEPVVMVYNPRRFTADTVPRTRRDLLRLLEREPASLTGRVGTYDIATSSVGYLLAEQDELVSSNFWGLANAFGKVRVQLRVNSGAILDEIEAGTLDLAYNVLGSYALSREASGRNIGVVVPQDYVLVLARAALIARQTRNPEIAHAFLDWLLSPSGQAVAASHAGLGAIMEGTPGPWTAQALQGRSQGIVQPIVFGPALMVGLDRQRHGRFVQNWLRLMTDAPGAAMTGR